MYSERHPSYGLLNIRMVMKTPFSFSDTCERPKLSMKDTSVRCSNRPSLQLPICETIYKLIQSRRPQWRQFFQSWFGVGKTSLHHSPQFHTRERAHARQFVRTSMHQRERTRAAKRWIHLRFRRHPNDWHRPRKGSQAPRTLLIRERNRCWPESAFITGTATQRKMIWWQGVDSCGYLCMNVYSEKQSRCLHDGNTADMREAESPGMVKSSTIRKKSGKIPRPTMD